MLLLLANSVSYVVQIIFCGLILSFSVVAIWRMFPRGKIKGYHKRCVLITGCDSGFGKDTAIRLDQMGFHVFATCLTRGGEERLKEVCSDRTKTFHLDVTNSEEIISVLERVREKLPPASGRICIPNGSTYAITEYGIEAFSDALRREMAPWGVDVSVMEPGNYATAMSDPILVRAEVVRLWRGLSVEMRREYGQESFDRYNKLLDKHLFKHRSPNRSEVVDAVVDALTSQSPRTRYVIGVTAKMMAVFGTWVPTCVVDKFLSYAV